MQKRNGIKYYIILALRLEDRLCNQHSFEFLLEFVFPSAQEPYSQLLKLGILQMQKHDLEEIKILATHANNQIKIILLGVMIKISSIFQTF